MDRWSVTASSSGSSIAADPQRSWPREALRFIGAYQEPSAVRADEGQDRSRDSGKNKANQDIMDEDLAHSLFAEEAVRGFAQYSRRLGRLRIGDQQDTDRVLEEFLRQEANYNTQQIIADLSATLRPLQMENYQNLALGSMNSDEEPPSPMIRLNYFPPSAGNEPGSDICVACRCDITGKFVKLECGSKYDIDCLKLMFETNFNDEYSFPPRCCGRVVALRHVENDLSKEILALYKAKIAEYSTPSRLYCSNAQCAQFLGARKESAESVSCSKCSNETCALCSAPAHEASVKCRIDKGLRKALKLGQSNGWQRCPRCRQLVERDNGCYHMSCRCGAQFCYLCAGNWSACSCKYRRNRLVRLVCLRWLHVRGNYLVKSEPGANGEGSVTRFCKQSWRNVMKIVTPCS